ncbi:adenylate/guanylate cyclase domain-containing protein [Roseobacter sp. YSTF-M11]|uniref:Adenylate/guanylate cyclase domain-containing protein n=1 Tax=Roseobacter insulae TaxID=2859783 RepID=A0A9X1FYG6_9RHOB|nr:adenylate/guanylate cyclase domain-containing protein [Roseobacter insulae]MBW4710001.1 adenylate/guanylate cyclase domain-containing protein [Roseobacter insulae]
MSIEAINEQLLRAIGVGVALVDLSTMTLGFRNDTFAEWFGPQDNSSKLGELFPAIDMDEIQKSLRTSGRYTTEASFKLRRRTMTVAMEFNRAAQQGGSIAVLVCQNITRIKELESMIDSYSVMVERNTREIKREKDQVEKLLLDMMPRSAYEEYKSFGIVAPRVFEPVSVLALDFVDFDALIAKHEPGVIVSELNDIYSALDRIGEQFGCQRIRTHGDSYISVSGVPDAEPEHAMAVANAAVRFLRYLKQRNDSHPIRWQPRVGLAAGEVVGSVVGVQRYIYDVFGPAVSRALSLRRVAAPMSIRGDAAISEFLDDTFDFQDCPAVDGVKSICVSERSAAPAAG